MTVKQRAKRKPIIVIHYVMARDYPDFDNIGKWRTAK